MESHGDDDDEKVSDDELHKRRLEAWKREVESRITLGAELLQRLYGFGKWK